MIEAILWIVAAYLIAALLIGGARLFFFLAGIAIAGSAVLFLSYGFSGLAYAA